MCGTTRSVLRPGQCYGKKCQKKKTLPRKRRTFRTAEFSICERTKPKKESLKMSWGVGAEDTASNTSRMRRTDIEIKEQGWAYTTGKKKMEAHEFRVVFLKWSVSTKRRVASGTIREQSEKKNPRNKPK